MLRKRWNHVSAERVLSGAGLVNLYEALCALNGIEPGLRGKVLVNAAVVALEPVSRPALKASPAA